MTTMFEELMTGLDEVQGFLSGKAEGYRATVPAEVDVKSIRKQLKMTQASFSAIFGFSLDAVKHWEGGRRTPEASARAFLTVISRDPEAVIGALHTEPQGKAGRRIRLKDTGNRGTRRPAASKAQNLGRKTLARLG